MPFRGNRLLGHQIQLRQQRFPIHVHGELAEPLAPAPGLAPALFAAGRHQLIGQKQGPLALDVFELGQFLPLVVQTGVVFHHGLVAIAAEALVAVGPAQLGADLVAGALHEFGVLHGPGRVADHGETGRIHFLAGGFTGQEAGEGAAQAHDRIVGNVQAAAPVAVGAVEIQALQSF